MIASMKLYTLLSVVAFGAHVKEYVDYTAAGIRSRGFISYDSGLCTAANTCPGVVIIPDWNGMNQYEMDRACSLASMGYVAFAADIYGTEIVNSWGGAGNYGTWGSAAGSHLQDAVLYMGKIVGALTKLSAYEFVNSMKLAAIGYCFGGTGVINLALAGHGGTFSVPTGLLGVAAYHAGANGLLNATEYSSSSRPKLLVHHGVADESAFPNMSMSHMELQMESAGATYEVQRYGPGVGHGFTAWGGYSYSARADRHSWTSTTSFLTEIFAGYDTPGQPGAPTSPILASHVNYIVENVDSRGYLAYDGSICTAANKCPGVLVVQDWNGMNQYEMDRAHLLAATGYVAFAADIYGIDIVSSWGGEGNFGTWGAAASTHLQDAGLYMGKIMGALTKLSGYEFVDSTKLAAIGYCFGGTGVMNLALAGHGGTFSVPTGLLGVVAYHAGANGLLDPTGLSPSSRPRLAVHQGRDDPAIPIETMTALEGNMESAGVVFDIVWYGNGVGHGFTHWGGFAYDARADYRSWEATKSFLSEIFDGVTAGSTQPANCAVGSPDPSDPSSSLDTSVASADRELGRPLLHAAVALFTVELLMV